MLLMLRNSMRYISIFLIACLFSIQAFSNSIKSDTIKYVNDLVRYSIDSGQIIGDVIKAEPCNQEENSVVALIIAGSGPTNADGNGPFIKSNTYKYIAQELGRNGISSVRYDKRGIGRSMDHAPKERDLRFDTYINDANIIINGLHEQGYKRIIIIGHSEGSLIGMIVASKNKYVTKFISIAGAGSSADIVLKAQLKEQSEEIGKMAEPMIDSIKAGLTVKNVPPFLKSVFRKSVQGYMASWFKYDPQVEIKKLTIPILIIQGTNDLQVKVNDAQFLYLANNTATLKFIDNMNHVLRIVESEDKNENIKAYNNPNLPVSEELLKMVVEFCR